MSSLSPFCASSEISHWHFDTLYGQLNPFLGMLFGERFSIEATFSRVIKSAPERLEFPRESFSFNGG